MTPARRHDLLIFPIMAVLAACGLIYEYLLSHYAGRVLGAVEPAIYGVIGLMIVAMGVGAYAARYFRDCFTAFAWLEMLIALVGATAVLGIAAVLAMVNTMPLVIAEAFGLPPDLAPRGGWIQNLVAAAEMLPFLVGFALGLLIGMEIPLMGHIRERLYQSHLSNNMGSIYGIDYLGAGLGAAIWIWLMLSMEITLAASLTAAVNLAVGLLFLVAYRDRIRYRWWLLGGHGVVMVIVLMIMGSGASWEAELEDMLYQDKVVYRANTRFQHLTVTERHIGPTRPPVLTFHINGRTQFSSQDESIYHAMLVYPAMAVSARHEKILIIGGGDGLALRDVLLWQPKEVTLLDLDPEVVRFFSEPLIVDGREINARLLKQNRHAFSDSRVKVRFGDAFLTVEDLIREGRHFDTIIVDLPDPGHPDLNKLYSSRFYSKLKELLSGDGAMAVQSTSPYHAKRAFLSIGKTIRHAGFDSVEQYHHNVPSFGEWGWTIATKAGRSATRRLAELPSLPIDDGWTTKKGVLAAFEFGKNFFDELPEISINRLGSGVAYQYHQQAWEKEQGVYSPG